MSTHTSADSLLTAGIDVGSSAVKFAVMRLGVGEETEVLALHTDRIHRRDLRKVIAEGWASTLEESGVTDKDLAYIASTGEGEQVM